MKLAAYAGAVFFLLFAIGMGHASQDARGDFSLWLSVRVRGSQGERVRRRAAEELSVRWPWWFTILALPWGIVYGGGARLRVRVVDTRSTHITDEPIQARWTSVWSRPAP